ncbi:MAG: hypothetical protein AAF183_17925 [Pseudomonadota bacterium]
MIALGLRSNLPQARARTRHQRSQVPFATSLALNRTAEDAVKNARKRIERAFDRPTPFTKKGVTRTRATKRRLSARVLIKDKQAAYLQFQERGGTRRPKRRAIVIPQRARTNKYGNLARGAVRKLLARADTFTMGAAQGRRPGIYRRTPTGAKLLVSYEQRARYSPRFRFAETVQKTARSRFQIQFRRAMTEAMRTAR